MNELNSKKRIEKKDAGARWQNLVEKAEAKKAAYLAKFEGRTPGEKYRLSQERVAAAKAEKTKRMQ